MSETLERQPTEREQALSAHARRVAFHRSIEVKAAELRDRGAVSVATAPATVTDTAAPVAVTPVPTPAFFKQCWFMIDGVTPNGKLTLKEIRRAVAEHFDLPMGAMLVGRRTKDWVRPRQIAMYLCSELTTKTLPDIGRAFGGADHTTVLHATRRIDAMIKVEPQIAADVTILRHHLEGLL